MSEACPDCREEMKKYVVSLTRSFALGISAKSLLPTELKKYNFLDVWICENCGHVDIHLRIT
ncbi:MAG: hypothetical protein RMJ14_03610 [Nitrososphaerota archaeon]|nr:hypothetical protein [Aigarchaeota archaeon]MDW8076707.1 hypothetical protein [Nitrososphaerota archaeon]